MTSGSWSKQVQRKVSNSCNTNRKGRKNCSNRCKAMKKHWRWLTQTVITKKWCNTSDWWATELSNKMPKLSLIYIHMIIITDAARLCSPLGCSHLRARRALTVSSAVLFQRKIDRRYATHEMFWFSWFLWCAWMQTWTFSSGLQTPSANRNWLPPGEKRVIFLWVSQCTSFFIGTHSSSSIRSGFSYFPFLQNLAPEWIVLPNASSQMNLPPIELPTGFLFSLREGIFPSLRERLPALQLH